jgi:hypothetical protein
MRRQLKVRRARYSDSASANGDNLESVIALAELANIGRSFHLNTVLFYFQFSPHLMPNA